MGQTETSLREEYARYFFSVLDASMHQDEVGRRQAQKTLEEVLTRVAPPITSGRA